MLWIGTIKEMLTPTAQAQRAANRVFSDAVAARSDEQALRYATDTKAWWNNWRGDQETVFNGIKGRSPADYAKYYGNGIAAKLREAGVEAKEGEPLWNHAAETVHTATVHEATQKFADIERLHGKAVGTCDRIISDPLGSPVNALKSNSEYLKTYQGQGKNLVGELERIKTGSPAAFKLLTPRNLGIAAIAATAIGYGVHVHNKHAQAEEQRRANMGGQRLG